MATNRKKKKPQNKTKKQENVLTWDSLTAEKDKLLRIISEEQGFLASVISTELTQKDLDENPEFAKALQGLDKTYEDLIHNTLSICKEHGEVKEEIKIENSDKTFPVVECQKGKVDLDNIDELMKYQCLCNKYAEIGFSLGKITTSSMGQVLLGAIEIKAKRENTDIKSNEEVKNIKELISGFEDLMQGYNLDNIHTIVPTKEQIKKEYNEAVEKTQQQVKEELADIEKNKPELGSDEQGEKNGRNEEPVNSESESTDNN